MEFEFKSDGTLRYANNSNYKSDVMIRKEGLLQKLVVSPSEGVASCYGRGAENCGEE